MRRRPRRLKPIRPARLFPVWWAVLLALNIVVVMTATNTVPPSRAGNQVSDVMANDLKPAACDALDLTNVEGGSVTVTGTAANDLVLGSELLDSLGGEGGDDCLVGGSGADTLDGGAGNDICLSGDGTDIFVGCETEIQ